MSPSKLFSFTIVALLVTVLFAGLVSIPAAESTDPMQFYYNAQHTGYYSPAAGATSPNGQLKWSYATGNFVDSSPAIANGVVYIGGQDSKIYALEATSGSKCWSYTMGGATDSSPAVANGVVYIGGQDGNVYAIGTALTQPTQLSLSVTDRTPAVDQSITFSDTLSTGGTSPAPIANAPVFLQYAPDSFDFATASSSPAITKANGSYTFNAAFPHAWPYYYRAYYGGTTQQSAAYSPALKVVVH